MSNELVNKVYADGDKNIYFPLWRQITQQEISNLSPADLEEYMQQNRVVHEDEIALKHPINGSVIKVCDDGAIEMFVNEDTGIRLDPVDNAIILYGDCLQVATKEARINTRPHGFIWNNHNINPYLYAGDKEGDKRHIPKVATMNDITAKNVPLFQEQTRKIYFDDRVNELVESINIRSAKERRGV